MTAASSTAFSGSCDPGHLAFRSRVRAFKPRRVEPDMMFAYERPLCLDGVGGFIIADRRRSTIRASRF